MTIRGLNRGVVAEVAGTVLIALLAVGTPAVWAAGPTTSAKPATALTVLSEPVGAAVFVDGKFAGKTPVAIDDVLAGDHTLRLVKDGYLENSRTLSVPASGRSLQVALTPTAPRPYAAMQVEPTPQETGGKSSKKWLWIGLGAVAVGAGAFVALSGGNKAPTVGGVTANPSIALQAATGVTFSANASDPDGDPLTYNWNFGDGGSGSGASPTHVFDGPGGKTVTVEVSDGKKTASGSTSVDVRNLTGNWLGTIQGTYPIAMVLTQSGVNVTGGYADPDGPGSVSGNVSGPFGVRLTVNQPGFGTFAFTGNASPDVSTISGNVFDTTFTMRRQ